MKRIEFIEKLAKFLDTFPEGCSNYHICDMLISKAEKMGMLPPDTLAKNGFEYENKWEEEDEEDYL